MGDSVGNDRLVSKNTQYLRKIFTRVRRKLSPQNRLQTMRTGTRRSCAGLQTAALVRSAEVGNTADHLLEVLSRDEARAFELTRRIGVTRAPQEIVVVEAVARVVPAAVAGVIVDDPVRRRELVGRMREAADHH